MDGNRTFSTIFDRILPKFSFSRTFFAFLGPKIAILGVFFDLRGRFFEGEVVSEKILLGAAYL